MGIFEGGFLRLIQTALYALTFCVSGIILGVYSYFLAVLRDRDDVISKQDRAIEGISGSAVLYCIFAVILTCCLGGFSFFGFIAVVLNILFFLGFIALTYLTRDGAHSCSGTVTTPLGTGTAQSGSGFGSDGFGSASGSSENTTYKVTYGTACKLNKVAFAMSIAGIVLFLILALVQVLLVKNHKKESRYGPSPKNNYTSGSGRGKFWRRNRGVAAAGTVGAGTGAAYATRDPEMAAVDTRPSHDTAFTGSTIAGGHQSGVVKEAPPIGHSTHGGYYTQPEGTGANPYGYTNEATTNSRNF